jgi:predicted 3-demethylubiquinone-9 3-methyltransferase (glyoxalase superfamily)
MSTKITPFLWFNDQAEEAAKFYTSSFKNSKIGSVARYGEGGPGPKGSVMTVNFQLGAQSHAGHAEDGETRHQGVTRGR